MPTFDEMVVKFLFDTTDLEKGAKEATAATAQVSKQLTDTAGQGEKAQTGALSSIVKGWNAMAAANRKAADAAVQNSKAMSSATETVVQSGEKALRTFGALFLLFAGARSVKDFVTDMIGVDAALGRTAKNIGQTPEALSGIGRAVERMGGSFNGAVGGLKGLSDAFEQMRTTGNSAINEPLARLQGLSGRAIKFGKDVHENFLSIADALHAEQAKDPAMADYLGRQILGDEGLTNLAKKGRAGVLAEEAKSPKITRQQTEDAQKLQEQLAAVRQGFQDIGNAILMSFGPSMIRAAEWVKDLVEKNRGLIETKVAEWARDVGTWFRTHKTDIENFGKAVGDLAAVAGTLATAFASQSPMMQALEAFAVLMGGRVLGAITSVAGALTRFGAMPIPPALAFLMNPAVLGTAAVGAVLASGDPDKIPLIGKHLDVQPQDSDLGLPGVGDRRSDTGDAQAKSSGAWAWLKSKLGFGDDSKVKDGIEDTAKATGEIRDILKAQKDGLGGGFNGVTESSGGLGGSGHHADGSSPGASLRDRQFHGKGNFGQKGWWTPERQSHAVDALMQKAGLTEAGAKALVARWRFVESAGGPTAVNPKSGAEGIAQWLGTRKGDGSSGSFDEQLDKVARELNGKEGRAKTLLNTPGAEARGASAYERAEGWNAATATDNFTGRVAEGMKHIAHGAAPAAQAGSGETAPATSSGPSEADYIAALRRMNDGWKSRPASQARLDQNKADEAIRDAYVKTHPDAWKLADKALGPTGMGLTHVEPGPEVRGRARTLKADDEARQPRITVDHAVRRALHAIAHANKLTAHNDNHPVPVTDAGAMKLQERTFGAFTKWGARHPDALEHAKAVMHGRAASLNHMTRLAAGASYSHAVHNTSNSDTRIGSITVQTAATDARGIAADIEPHLHRGQAAGRADYGLA